MSETPFKKRHSRPLQPTGPLSDDWLFADPFSVLGEDGGDFEGQEDPAPVGASALGGTGSAAHGRVITLAAALIVGSALGVGTHQMSVILSIQEPASECARFPEATPEVVTDTAYST